MKPTEWFSGVCIGGPHDGQRQMHFAKEIPLDNLPKFFKCGPGSYVFDSDLSCWEWKPR